MDKENQDSEIDCNSSTKDIKSTMIGFLNTGIIRFILTLCLPFVLYNAKGEYVLNANDYFASPRYSGESESAFLSSFKDSCEIGSLECVNKKCILYNEAKFLNSSSVFTMYAGGRLGNMISAYLYMSWLHWEYGLNVYFERKSHKHMSKFFKNINMPILEDTFCDYRKFPFEEFEGDIDLLGQEKWAKGKAVEVHYSQSNFMKQEVLGGKRFHRLYRKEANQVFAMKDKYQNFADSRIREIRDKVIKSTQSNKPVLFIGMHNRRTDYLKFRKLKLGLNPIYTDYFQDAIAYFDEEYGTEHELVFVHVSDDMKWGEKKLKKIDDRIYLVGCGSPDSTVCIGKDFALLKSCNHSIITHGTFGHWSSYLAGGDVYTEYGVLVPGSY
ncbi:galactoside 2-alpha-L-fucosyltransferase SEC1 [Lepeophtheirus salmonis]|uniref:galactoside 2-alpha-L-fucosyltransferase SEC1 n=1 Tax=Lepeophtheirus salmonis TaxID=72036 RepID=UPI001AE7D1CE|nr:galactoside 2-alpha-L-fucosyltransferase SEC1-like [Lepeophtheirus salmonis]